MQNLFNQGQRFWRKNWWFAVLLAAELIFLGFRFAGQYNSGQAVTVGPDQMIPYYGKVSVDENGVLVEGEGTGTEQVFAVTDTFDLYAGSYQLTLYYENVGAATTFNFGSEVAGLYVPELTYDPLELQPTHTQATGQLWVSYDRIGDSAVYLRFIATCAEGQSARIIRAVLTPTHGFAWRNLFSWLAAFAVLDYLLLLLLRRVRFPLRTVQSRYTAVVLAGIVVFACLPLGLGYTILGDDLSVHLNRIETLAQTLTTGQFPARLYPTVANGKGYPFGIMYPDLLLYPFALLRLMGFGLGSVYRCYVLVITAATALVTWYVLRKIFESNTLALVGTGLYVLSFYRLINVYVRCAMGEYTAMLFLPLVVYGLWCIYTQSTAPGAKPKPWCWLPLALGYTGLLQSHLLTTFMAAFFTVLLCLVLFRRTFSKPVFFSLCKGAGVAVCWNLWYLVPFLQYMAAKVCRVSAGGSNPPSFLKQALFPVQLFTTFGKVGAYAVGTEYGFKGDMPLTLGTVLGLAACLMLMVLLDTALRRKNRALAGLGGLCLGFGALAAWMCCTVFPWYELFRYLPGVAELFENIQFPWRFLSPATVFLVTAGCCGLALLGKKHPHLFLPLAAAMLVLTVLPAGQLMFEACMNADVEDYLSNAALTERIPQVSNGEYLPIELYNDSLRDENDEPMDVHVVYNTAWDFTTPLHSDEVELTGFAAGALCNSFSAHNTAEENRTVRLPLFYYPGYELTGAEGAILTQDSGYVAVILPAGWQGNVTVTWHQRWYWHVFDVFSLLAVAATVWLYKKHPAGLPLKARGKGQ